MVAYHKWFLLPCELLDMPTTVERVSLVAFISALFIIGSATETPFESAYVVSSHSPGPQYPEDIQVVV
jgi:hypothetical protein